MGAVLSTPGASFLLIERCLHRVLIPVFRDLQPFCLKEPLRHEAPVAVRPVLLEAEHDDVASRHECLKLAEHRVRVEPGEDFATVTLPEHLPVSALIMSGAGARVKVRAPVYHFGGKRAMEMAPGSRALLVK